MDKKNLYIIESLFTAEEKTLRRVEMEIKAKDAEEALKIFYDHFERSVTDVLDVRKAMLYDEKA